MGSACGETRGALLCLDCTENTVAEAADCGYNLVISHHPAIFRGIERVTDETPTGRMILAAARLGVSVYSAHTNLDFCKGGINDYAAELIGLTDVRPMTESGGVGVGRIGSVSRTTAGALARKCAAVFGDRRAAVAGDEYKTVNTVAVVNGGGGSIEFLTLAARLGADCYITGDVPHHVALYAAECGTPIVVLGHYAAERIYMKRLGGLLSARAEEAGFGVTFEVSATERDPIRTEDL